MDLEINNKKKESLDPKEKIFVGELYNKNNKLLLKTKGKIN